MDFDGSAIKTVKAAYDLTKLINTISNGKAIMFTGAGFTFGAKRVNDKKPLGAGDLSIAISKELGLHDNKNLKFTSDYFLSKKPALQLIQLLKDNFTLKETSSTQNIICSLPWLRYYTTNYDLSIEMASKVNDKIVESIDIDKSVTEYYKRNDFCVHLNGSINSLTEDSLNKSFKLSQSSYISSDSFISSDWYYAFRRDLDRASAIVFIGYSMYDIEIQKVLTDDPKLISKTFFITSQNPELELEYTLSKFGTVISIGSDNFASEILSNIAEYPREKSSYEMQALSLYEHCTAMQSVRDSQIENMLMYGDITDNTIDSCILGHLNAPVLIPRHDLRILSDIIEQDKHLIFYGGLGNGKSILLKEARCHLTALGFDVYNVDDLHGDYIGDIDYLSTKKNKSIILLDDYEHYIDIINHISKTNPQNILIIATARIADHEYHRDALSKNNFDYRELNIDFLFDDEIQKFTEIIDNLGLWGERAGLTSSQKQRHLKIENEGQISVTLLSLLGSPNIRAKISGLVEKLKVDKSYEYTLLTICICRILGVNTSRSLISDLAGNDAIYNPKLTQMSEFRQLFRFVNGEIEGASSLFCICLVKDHFTASNITTHLLSIAAKLDTIKQKDAIQTKVFKSMLKFSFVERILPSTTKLGNLQRYYEDLKIEINWLRNDPHFWLQYAMAVMAFKKYDPKAQTFLNQAYALAEKKTDYHTNNIDTQQARLWLLMCSKENDGAIIYDYFNKANTLLGHLKNDIYKFRQIARYREFYDANFSKLSKVDKPKFLAACNRILSDIEKIEDTGNISQQLARTKSILKSIVGES